MLLDGTSNNPLDGQEPLPVLETCSLHLSSTDNLRPGTVDRQLLHLTTQDHKEQTLVQNQAYPTEANSRSRVTEPSLRMRRGNPTFGGSQCQTNDNNVFVQENCQAGPPEDNMLNQHDSLKQGSQNSQQYKQELD